MRTLWEAIQSSDDDIAAASNKSMVPYRIVDIFCDTFAHMYRDKDSKYDQGSDYVAGRIPVSNYDKMDKYKTETELKKDLRKFCNSVRSEFAPKVLVQMKTKRDQVFRVIDRKDFRIIISIDGDAYGLTVQFDTNPTAKGEIPEVNYIRVISGNPDLTTAFHNKVK